MKENNKPKKINGDDSVVENIVVLFLVAFFVLIFIKVVFL